MPAGANVELQRVAFMSSYGFGPAVERWGGFLSDVVCVPYAEHMLVPIPAGLEPAAVASASDNISDAWRAVAPALAEQPGAPVLVVGGAGAGLDRPVCGGRWRWRWGRSRCCTWTRDERGVRRRKRSARRRCAETPQRVGPFAITVDASADPGGLALALRSTAPDGICTSTAIYFGEQPSLPLLEMYTKGITFKTGA